MKVSKVLITLLTVSVFLSSCTEEAVSPTGNKSSIVSYNPIGEKSPYEDIQTPVKEEDFMPGKQPLKTPPVVTPTGGVQPLKDESVNTPILKIEEE